MNNISYGIIGLCVGSIVGLFFRNISFCHQSRRYKNSSGNIAQLE